MAISQTCQQASYVGCRAAERSLIEINQRDVIALENSVLGVHIAVQANGWFAGGRVLKGQSSGEVERIPLYVRARLADRVRRLLDTIYIQTFEPRQTLRQVKAVKRSKR